MPECTPGQEICFGPHLYVCLEGTWVIAEYYSSQCMVPPPECTLGETKCEGYNLYTCGADEKWHLTEENSTQCGYTPPVCSHHYRVIYLDGSSGIISWKSDPITKPNLWDFVDRDELLSWTYLGCY